MARQEAAIATPKEGALDVIASLTQLPTSKMISQGAEARVWEVLFLQRPTIMKQRFKKQYRHHMLDAKLTINRIKQEVRSIARARKLGVLTPAVYSVELEARSILMERVHGSSVKDCINNGLMDDAALEALMATIGRTLAVLHDGGLIHGDLTTSNMIVRDSDKALVLIDFGLSYNSIIPEDKGVDLYVLERALTSAHSQHPQLFDKILTAYKRHSKQWSATWNRFAEVRLRGRKRAMVG